ncbi:class I adenylate-forming enzyme family protein [Paenibacillus sp. GCM10012306]|uniref:class I adenylate-forming enzyme family protein n=1 Tax=Paenibacillus sp. GCM10012306 TaxID=3317342 RepID=UPI0036D2D88B
MRESDKTALINLDQEQLSYQELYTSSNNFAKYLQESSVNVITLLPNDLSYVVALFGIWYASRTAVPLGVDLTDSAICTIAEFCEADTIIIEAKDSGRDFGRLKPIIINKHLFDQHKLTVQPGFLQISPNSIALLLSTTGTSSSPKYVQLTHDNILSAVKGISTAFELVEDCCELIIGPLGFSTSLVAQLMVVLYSKGKLVIYSGPINPQRIARLIKQYNVTFTGATTSLAKLIFNNNAPEELSSLKGLVTGGEPVTKEFIEMLSQSYPHCRVMQCYGLTETSSMATGYISDAEVPIGSAGKAMSHVQIRIVNENGEECPAGVRGEILFRGDSVTKGYYKNDSLNAAAFDNGWFKTGDIGMLDEQGYLFILGRLKNMLIVGGQNVYPEEVEECLLSHPLVQNAYVYGEEHEVLGEAPVAKVVLKPEAVITENELYRHCKERLSSLKIPKRIIFEDKISLNAMGKQIRIKRE